MYKTLDKIDRLDRLIEKTETHGVWDMRGFMLNVINREEVGGYCKGPTQVGTYIAFSFMPNSELAEVMDFLEKCFERMTKPRRSLERALKVLASEFQFRGETADQKKAMQLVVQTREKGDALQAEFVAWFGKGKGDENGNDTHEHEEYRPSVKAIPISTTVDTVRQETVRLLELAQEDNTQIRGK